MKIKSWPLPPLADDYKKPQIPDEFRIFGIDYLFVDNKIVPKDIANSEYDKEVVLQLIKESYSKYLVLLDGLRLEEVEDIKTNHLKLNEELNKCKEKEVEFELKRLKNEKNKKINQMLGGILSDMNKKL